MSITVSVAGTADLKAALIFRRDETERALRTEVRKAGLAIVTGVRQKIQKGPKSGHVYTEIFRTMNGVPRPVGPRTGNNLSPSHQASAPGEAPATDTGSLVKSIDFKQSKPLEATVGSSLIYGAYLEFGTRRIAPRPAWAPTVAEVQPKFQAAVAAAVRKVWLS